MDLPQASQTFLLWGGVWGCFFSPLMNGSVADQDVSSYSGGQHESTVPAPWWEQNGAPCSQHSLKLLSCAPSSASCPRAPTQGCTHTGMLRDWSKASKQTKPTTKHTPLWFILHSSLQTHGENLIKNSLKCQQCTHNYTFLPSFDSPVSPHTDLNASPCRWDGDRQLKPQKEMKSQVLFNRALWGRQTNTLYLLTDISVVFPGWQKCCLDIISTRN